MTVYSSWIDILNENVLDGEWVFGKMIKIDILNENVLDREWVFGKMTKNENGQNVKKQTCFYFSCSFESKI